MTWMQFLLAFPVALLGVVLFHDFMAGLGEERLWGEPFPNDEASVLTSGTARMTAERSAAAEVAAPAPALQKAG